MSSNGICGLAVATLLAMPAAALAQAPPKTDAPVMPKAEQGKPDACAPAHATVGKGADIKMIKPPEKPPSEQLAQSNGVICPPKVDQEMAHPAPPGGTMPVLPPPGTPGGDQSVVPK